jgi:hypothetical protein
LAVRGRQIKRRFAFNKRAADTLNHSFPKGEVLWSDRLSRSDYKNSPLRSRRLCGEPRFQGSPMGSKKPMISSSVLPIHSQFGQQCNKIRKWLQASVFQFLHDVVVVTNKGSTNSSNNWPKVILVGGGLIPKFFRGDESIVAPQGCGHHTKTQNLCQWKNQILAMPSSSAGGSFGKLCSSSGSRCHRNLRLWSICFPKFCFQMHPFKPKPARWG